jgi:predicted polyphosphate/ATP-dependent NAD kinase
MTVIGFVVNPIAGMGGRVGLKGTDGVADEARARGAVPVAGEKSRRTLEALLSTPELVGMREKPLDVNWLAASGEMGAKVLSAAGVPDSDVEIVYSPKIGGTTADDTIFICKIFLARKVDLVIFCGGDGTARDVFTALEGKIPMLGIPAGVKMHSGVFGVTPEGTAQILSEYLDGQLSLAEVEIIDLDEEKYRDGQWNLKLFGTVNTPFEPSYIQGSKLMIESATDDEVKEDIANFIKEEIEEAPGVVFILGPGSTMATVGEILGVETTLLGIDAVMDSKVLGNDINEKQLLKILDEHQDARLLLSPIGNQGFVLGRGNHQLSPEVIRKIGLDNIWILTTPAKLTRTPVLRVDTGDPELDKQMDEHKSYRIVVGYRIMRREALRKTD